MENLTIVIPYFNGADHILGCLEGIPTDIPVVIVDDQSDVPLHLEGRNITVYRPSEKMYFSGAVNYALDRTLTDVLVLNQDVKLQGTAWLDLIATHRKEFALIGERIRGTHPAFPNGYVHGVFQFMRRDAINKVGGMNAEVYPLWGGSALWQLQICRSGFRSMPVVTVPGLSHWHHSRKTGQRYGDSIQTLLGQEPDRLSTLIRTPPEISVIVPSYNYGRFLEDCLNSLLGGDTCLGWMPGQTFQSFEVIIINDGSTDSTDEIAKSYLTGWNGVRYIQQPNRGLPAAENRAIKDAIGKYITILSADDMREPWSLQDLYEAAIRNPTRVIYDEPTVFRNGSRGDLWRLAEYDFENLLDRNMMHSGIMFDRSAWADVGGYPEQFFRGREDWAFNVALGEKGYCGLKIGRSGYLYRREGHNRSNANSSHEWRQYFIVEMAKRFPHLYRGERPMGCCSEGKGSRVVRSASGFRTVQSPMASAGEMVLVEYIGSSHGSRSWGGPGGSPSGTYYTFGLGERHKVKYVRLTDLDWILNQYENSRPLFRKFETAVAAAIAGTVAPTGTLTVQRVVPTSPVADEDDEDDEDENEDEDWDDEDDEDDWDGDDGEEEQPPIAINTLGMTVAEVRALELDSRGWAAVIQSERAGKNRVGVVEYAKAKLGLD